ncbi:Protein phosphatase 1 regulatory subunit 3D [Elasticomyces elasticus]|nr:Protein phosphatase 1 regulatory subunit 3D [Elasticomyces elasticus]
MKFCLRYRVADREYWDNNQGENYTMVTKQTAPLIKKGILRLSTTSIAPDTRKTESVIEFHRSRVATFMESNAQRRSLTDDALAAVDLRKSRRPPQFSGYANLLGNIGDMKRLSNSMAT